MIGVDCVPKTGDGAPGTTPNVKPIEFWAIGVDNRFSGRFVQWFAHCRKSMASMPLPAKYIDTLGLFFYIPIDKNPLF